MEGERIAIFFGKGINAYDALMYAATVFDSRQCTYSEMFHEIGRAHSSVLEFVDGIKGEVWRTNTGHKIELRKGNSNENNA